MTDFDDALDGEETLTNALASEKARQRALTVKGSDGRTLRGQDRNPVIRRDVDDVAYQWLRDQYRQEHGSMDGWEQYARDCGFITVKSQRREWKHTITLDTDMVDLATGAHCPSCFRKNHVEKNTVE